MKENEKTIYCSLDIETSGFDPLTNEILEVGFAFFCLDKNGIKITEEWTQVFKPTKPVSAQILGLTGITQKELDEAPKFSEHLEFLQNKLGKAVILGHNIIFDIKFLEAFGVKFSGEIIDTLDLVQWILPTHHSYNLENLMHTFGIKHKEAHRALADSKATLKLMEKLLQVYNGFDLSLQKNIKKIIKSYDFAWKDFLDTPQVGLPLASLTKNKEGALKNVAVVSNFKFEPKSIYNFSLGQDFLKNIAFSQKKSKKSVLLVLPKSQQVLEFLRLGLVNASIFSPEITFDELKFEKLLKKKNLKPDEIKFVLKVSVWKNTNWQTDTILDLNLSFFGGQFKSLITGGDLTKEKKGQVLACDQAVFLELSKMRLYKQRNIVVAGLDEFEKTITSNIGTKTSWGYISYLLKAFYNLELNAGLEKFKTPVETGLAASDLFFGLVNAMFKTESSSFEYVKISKEMEYEERYQKIKKAAENYCAKLLELNKILESKAIFEMVDNLSKFFTPEENMVKWIELAESRCALLSMPVDIHELVDSALSPFANLSFADNLGPESLVNFFVSRLGLKGFKLVAVENLSKNEEKKNRLKQGDLFSGIKKAFLGKSNKINYHYLPSQANMEDLLGLIEKTDTLPAAVLFSSPLQVREFYEKNYQELKQKASVFAQSGSGGGNKILRNFAINPSSLLLATDKFILKSLNSQAQTELVDKLPVKALILCRLPFEQFTHPYQEAISESLPNAFMDYALPRALYNFQSLTKFFYTPILKDIYVIDVKLSKDYAKIFKDFYKFIPNAELKA